MKRRYSAAMVVRARELRAAGWSVRQIPPLLEEQFGMRPGHTTVFGWVNEKHDARRRELARNRERKSYLLKHGVRSRRIGPQLARARIWELHDRGLSSEDIAQVARLWWGEELTPGRLSRHDSSSIGGGPDERHV